MSDIKLWYDLNIRIPVLYFIMSPTFKVDNLENKILAWLFLEDLQTTRITNFSSRINAFSLLSYVPLQI